ncbi:MAG TPA: hypothetical protein VK550_03610, partial [Polyangiaceae bacterium]|nr:hypothetical protein [Polyangiaceae bacterium]
MRPADRSRRARIALEVCAAALAVMSAASLVFAQTAVSSSSLPPGHPRVASSASKAPAPPSSALPPGHPAVGAPASKTPAPSSSALPPGHPSIADDEDEGLPPGHPPQRGSGRGMQPETPPEDTSGKDDSLPPGSIVVEIRDKSDAAVPRADVTLGILQQSVAKGESRRRTTQKADENGNTRFDNLERGGGIAYRISVPWTGGGDGDSATYAAPPFQLDLHHGQRVRVHVYPVTSRVEDTLLGMQGVVYLELKDDVIQVDEIFEVFNLGSTTWVPSNVIVDLPRGFRAFNAQRDMSDVGFDVVAERGAKMRGTFGPGQHQAQFRYQIPYEGGESAKIALSLPPRVIRMRVIAEASKTMTLRVDEFPSAVSDANQRGTRVLLTERQARPGDLPLTHLAITLDNIPTEGSAKWMTVAISAATLAFGIYLASEQEKAKSAASQLGGKDTERARARLVA